MKNRAALLLFVLFGMLPLSFGERVEAPTEATVSSQKLPVAVLNGPVLSIEGRVISLLLADTEEKRVLGLGNREAIREDEGMLFVFPRSERYGIWMKDMRFPLDIVWFAPASTQTETPFGTSLELVVVDVKENVDPATYPEVFFPKKNALYVLEVRGGAAKKFGVNIGVALTLKR